MVDDRSWYADHLLNQLLPFWDRAFDDEVGGVYTCFSNDGKQLVSTDKFTWSQGRMLWCLSYLLGEKACSSLLSDTQRATYDRRAEQLYRHLSDHVLLEGEDEVTAFLTDRWGKPKPSGTGGLYSSMYADCFVILGFARYALYSSNAAIAKQALHIYRKMRSVVGRGIVVTEPYSIPAGCEAQAVWMIICNTASEVALSLESFGFEEADELYSEAKQAARMVLDRFGDREHHLIREVIGQCSELLARHRNPGHAIECMWFCLDALGQESCTELAPYVLSSLDMGWDEQYGGLLRYVDQDGDQPKGAGDGSAFSDLVGATWDYKLWWPHAEALYATKRFYRATGDRRFATWYEKLKDYTYGTFPAEKGCEWVQIRRRDGKPEETVVALPVKDPYHALRMHLLMLNEKD